MCPKTKYLEDTVIKLFKMLMPLFRCLSSQALFYRKNSASCLSVCLHTTELQGDKPGLVNHKDKRCEYYIRHFSPSLPTVKTVGQSRNLNFRKTGNNEYVILWYM
jgi:hypothetical protein